MAAGNVSRVIRAPGRLVVGPQDAFADGIYPFSGTEVGKVKACALTPMGEPFRVQFEGLGEVGDVLEGSNRWVFSCFLRGWDPDAVEHFLSDGFSVGDRSQHAVFSSPGNQRPGSSALGRAVVLAFVPDDPMHAPGVILYRAIPDWGDGAELAFRRGDEFGIPIAFECLRDASGRVLQVGRLADLEL